MITSKDITVNGIDITVHSDGSITKPFHKRTKRTFGHDTHTGYLAINIGDKKFRMHRIIAEAFLSDFLDFPEVDHIDGDKKSNDISNLRMATRSGQLRGFQDRKAGSSQYRGVYWHKPSGKWLASCRLDRKLKHLGLFTTEVDAALARDAYVFSQGFPSEGLNFPDCFIGLQCP